MQNDIYYGRCQQGAILGNSVDIKLKECDASEVRADVLVENATREKECHVVRLWGQVKDCNGEPVSNALIKLIKVTNGCNGKSYQGIAHTISDCEGFYQFDLCYCSGHESYKVLVGKAYTGPEEVIHNMKGNCDLCKCEKPSQMDYPTFEKSCQSYEKLCPPCEACEKPCHTYENPCKPCQPCEKPCHTYEKPYKPYEPCEKPCKPCQPCEKPYEPYEKPCQPCVTSNQSVQQMSNQNAYTKSYEKMKTQYPGNIKSNTRMNIPLDYED